MMKLGGNNKALQKRLKFLNKHQNNLPKKIKYTLITLPSVSVKDDDLMEVVSQSEELDIFRTRIIQDYIDYKWDTFGFKYNIGNLLCHSLYVFFLIQFINWNFVHCPNGYQ